ncbi:MAG: aminoacyl-tRNA hydrolase [Alphaproteobacteria bacterium]|nr:aminoacyl-tRNA hydrolase [Alphaproteobacteria bacterium]
MADPVAHAMELAEERFLAASGPGGQNVNKVATTVQLRCNAYALRLSPDAFRRLRVLAGSKMTAGGEIVITARRFRTQEQNRADARQRLAGLLEQALVEPEQRKKSRLNRVGKVERLKTKKARGVVKANRGKIRLD